MVGGVQFNHAVGAGSAAARPVDTPIARSDTTIARSDAVTARSDDATTRIDAAVHAHAMRSQGLHNQRLGRDLTTVASPGKPVPPPTVRLTRLTDGGFDWADAGIGAGLATALLLSAAGVSTLRRQHPATR
jgi:hypothetical protein